MIMKKENKAAVAASAVVICGMLVVGGISWLMKQKAPTDEGIGEEPIKMETMVASVECVDPIIPEYTPAPEVSVPVIEVCTIEIAKDPVQPIQEVPEKSESPQDPPELEEGADLTNPDKVPKYAEDPEPTSAPSDTVVTKPPVDDSHPGQIYVEGFGWIQDIGPGHGIEATEIYMNGNKIGDM